MIAPGHVTALVDDILEYARPRDSPVVEVGPGPAGTVSKELASRGVDLTCVEADRDTVDSLRRSLPGEPTVVVAHCRFEEWTPPGAGSFGLMYCGQSWHFLDPERRLDKALSVLKAGGTLALSWNYVANPASPIRQALARAHSARGLAHIGRRILDDHSAPESSRSCLAEIAESPLFGDSRTRSYSWSAGFSLAGYLKVLSAFTDRGLMTREDFDATAPDVTDIFHRFNSDLRLEMETKVYMTKSCPRLAA